MRGSRRLFLWGAIVVVFGFFGAVVFAAYMERFGGNGDPILVRAPREPLKYAPDDPGGLEVANESSNVVAALEDEPEPARPERILPREAPSVFEDPPPIDPVPADRPPEVEEPAVEQATPIAPPDPVPAPVEPETAPEPLEPPADVADLGPSNPPEPEPEPTPEPEPVAEPEPVTEPVIAAVPEPPAQPEAQPPAQPQIDFRLQLGAFGSDIAARLAWAAYRERFGEVIADLSPHIARSTGAETVFRLQAGPFPDRDSASSVCAAVKQRGGDCFVVAAN